jgi:hypothetical protein
MNGATAILGNALRVAATAAAASSLRRAASQAKMQLSLAILMGVAGLAGVVCLSTAAFIVLRDQLGAAEAWSLIGVLYLLLAVAVYFIGRRLARR